MASYYLNFVYQFANVANPLSRLISNNARFQWSGECQKAFDKLKSSLCESPVLKHPDYSEPFAIFTDASSYVVSTHCMSII
jgi:RNase H-like domain found in reverse transcriptase